MLIETSRESPMGSGLWDSFVFIAFMMGNVCFPYSVMLSMRRLINPAGTRTSTTSPTFLFNKD